ncbi:6-phosphogluconolactonase [Rhynchospora pubera]|uniref:Probable 6-phosphogluconolactonase n=1 Tax=Rhynchospora pubera TaxID=906938 RepID=A0AAV8GK47_9POAL|nr:6-phosphogluconolactonase [Rhynchospora pubera]
MAFSLSTVSSPKTLLPSSGFLRSPPQTRLRPFSARPIPGSKTRFSHHPLSVSIGLHRRQPVKMAAATGSKQLTVFDSEEELAVSLAKYTAELSDKFTRERGAFTVVLSGGSLIKALRKLTESPYLDSVEWSKWHIFWVDERVVKKDHPDSNYKLALDGFLSKVLIPPNQIYAINDTLPPEGAADDYEARLKQLVWDHVIKVVPTSGLPRFDIMLLGMGPDGHVASLFPGHPLLKETQKWVTHITDSPKPPPERITFTFPVINASAYVAMVVTGSGKAGAVHKALSGGENTGYTDRLPVEMVELEQGEFTWFTDKAAVSMLNEKDTSL